MLRILMLAMLATAGVTSANEAEMTMAKQDGTLITMNATQLEQLLELLREKQASNPVSTGQAPAGAAGDSYLIQFAYKSSKFRTNRDTTNWVELSTDYRVTITPKLADSTIRLKYTVPVQPGVSWHRYTLHSFRAFREVGGVRTYALSSQGQSKGSRNAIAGRTERPVGFDYNDPMWVEWDATDAPGTIGPVTYGFEYKRESGGSGRPNFGYSEGDNSVWGWDADIMITAEEHKNPSNSEVLPSPLVQMKYTSSKHRMQLDSTTFIEPSTNYRVSITPKEASSIMRIRMQIPLQPNVNYHSNTIYNFRIFRMVNGVKSYDLTSAGAANGSRNRLAGKAIRPVGYDSNDPMWLNIEAIDLPSTPSTVIYGFEGKRESTAGVLNLGYSQSFNSNWGFDSDIVITVEEFQSSSSAAVFPSAHLQSAHVALSTQKTIDSTSFVDAGYTLAITPTATDSVMRIRFMVPTNPGINYAANTIYTCKTYRSVGGSKAFDLTSAGPGSGNFGSSNKVAGLVVRPVGADLNDPMYMIWEAIDTPNTLSAVTYGFDFKRETGGSGNLIFGYTNGDNAAWGFSADVIILIDEYKP